MSPTMADDLYGGCNVSCPRCGVRLTWRAIQRGQGRTWGRRVHQGAAGR